MTDNITARYRTILSRWVRRFAPDLYHPEGREEYVVYGSGGSDNWGSQMQKQGLTAFAALLADPAVDYEALGLSRERLTALCRGMVRYTVDTHVSGDFHCTTAADSRWGHNWISAVGIERSADAVDCVWDALDAHEREGWRRMMASEADWLLDEYPVTTAIFRGNKAESCAWNGALLCRAALRYPDLPRAAEYWEKGVTFLINSLTCAADETNDTVVDGKPVRERFVAASYCDDFLLYHHELPNTGYMAVHMAALAMLHFSCRIKGKTPPAALYRNLERLWHTLRAFTADNGFVLRPGGDERIRYGNTQEMALPSLLLARDALGEDTRDREARWLDVVALEQDYNGDGSFYGKRTELLREYSPMYYYRIEADRELNLAAAYIWHLKLPLDGSFGTPGYTPAPGWDAPLDPIDSPVSGTLARVDPHRIVSFVWAASEKPAAMFLSPLDPTMSEMQQNLTSHSRGAGLGYHVDLGDHGGRLFEGGFVTTGCYTSVSDHVMDEGVTDHFNYKNHVSFAALPDGRTAVTLQYAPALCRAYLLESWGLNLNVPNDIFNGSTRAYMEGKGFAGVEGLVTVASAYGPAPAVVRVERRNINIRSMFKLGHSTLFSDRGHLRCDKICAGHVGVPTSYDLGTPVFDFGVALSTELDRAGAQAFAAGVRRFPLPDPALRAMSVVGLDGEEYIVCANFTDIARTVTVGGADFTVAPLDTVIISRGRELSGAGR